MNLKDPKDLTMDVRHTCDICQQFIPKKVYLEWVKNSYVDADGERHFDDMLKCERC